MFFKNLIVYRLTRDLEIFSDFEKLEQLLEEFSLKPCGSQDVKKFGWVPAFNGSDVKVMPSSSNFFIRARVTEKLLPPAIIKEYSEDRFASFEMREGRPPKKSEKLTIKDEVILELLPRAFTRSKDTCVAYLADMGFLLVGATSEKAASDVTALLRKSIGSLPIVPLMPAKSIPLVMTESLKAGSLNSSNLTFGDSASFAAADEPDNKANFKNQDLSSDEIDVMLANNKLVVKANLDWSDAINFDLDDDFYIRRINYSEDLKDQNDDIDRDDTAQRFDADLALVLGEFSRLLPDLLSLFGGVDEG
ncbi:recombination-associated protein RdgC [Photobacterium leiognathi]|uniref:recombination-associated protein RdgC n=1 Tax=Photobacterium leiognathi TaxID=553611 RepID=UPI002980C88A|nr:recombination-associated protein RdgC [Photobacterium leiognathi]